MDDMFSVAQVAQLRMIVVEAVREEFANVGLRVDDGAGVDAVRKDMSFLRWVREAGNRVAQKLGWLIIATLASGAFYIAKLGVDAYLSLHGPAK